MLCSERWVEDGNSVYTNPGAFCCPILEDIEFLGAFRPKNDLVRRVSSLQWGDPYSKIYDCCQGGAAERSCYRISELQRKLYWLWIYVDGQCLAGGAKEFIREHADEEQRALRGWVKEGNSVYENGTEMSFLDDYRYWDEIFEEESHLSGIELSRFEADLCHKSLEEYLQWFKDCFEVLVSFLKSNGLWDEAWAAVEEMEKERDKESWKLDDSGAPPEGWWHVETEK